MEVNKDFIVIKNCLHSNISYVTFAPQHHVEGDRLDDH